MGGVLDTHLASIQLFTYSCYSLGSFSGSSVTYGGKLITTVSFGLFHSLFVPSPQKDVD